MRRDAKITEKIRQGIEKFKEENGNVHFKESELLMYIVHRLDSLPCDNHLEKISDVCNEVKSWKWIAGVLVSITFSTILGLLWLLIK